MQKHQFPVGGGSKKVEDWGGGGAGVKKFRTGGYWGVPMLGGGRLLLLEGVRNVSFSENLA